MGRPHAERPALLVGKGRWGRPIAWACATPRRRWRWWRGEGLCDLWRRGLPVGSRGAWRAHLPVPGPAPASCVALSLQSRGLVGAGGRPTPLQAGQAGGPGHTRPWPGLAPLGRVPAGPGPRQVPPCRLSRPRLAPRPPPGLTDRPRGAWLPREHRGRLPVPRRCLGHRAPAVPQQRAAGRAWLLAPALRHAAAGPPPVAAAWRAVEPPPPPACHGREREGAQAVATRVVLRAPGPLAVGQGQAAVGRERPTRRGAGQGLQDRRGSPARFGGVAPPGLVAPRREARRPGGGREACPPTTRPGPVARRVGRRRTRRERTRTGRTPGGRPGPHRVPSAATPPAGRTPCRGGLGQGWAPGGEDGAAADLGAARRGGPGAIRQRLGARAHEEAIEAARGLERQRPAGRR